MKYNILFISNESTLGGAATSLIDMLKGIKSKNVNCIVVIPANGIIEERLQELGIRYHIVNFTMGFGPIGKATREDEDSNFYDNYSAAIRLQEIIKEENINLIHINSSVSNVGALAALRAGIPYVWHFREMLEEDFECEFWDKQLKKELISRSNCIISISKTVQESYRSKYNIDSVCIYDGIDIERYHQDVKWEGNEQQYNFIITGMISKNKGQWDAVKAIETLIKRGICNVHLTLLGSGNGRMLWVINKYIEQNKLMKYITIIPFQKDLKKYREGNVYAITTSKMEALGRCTIEAMMAGNIVIGADTGGTLEIIGKKNQRGYLYKQGDYENLADVMYGVVMDSADTKIKHLAAAQKYAEKTFALEEYADKIFSLYEKAIRADKKTDKKDIIKDLEQRYHTCSNVQIKNELFLSKYQSVVTRWNRLSAEGRSVSGYLKNRLFFKVAIYGMGNLGCRLYDELSATDIEIVSVIDKAPGFVEEIVTVMKTGEKLKGIDILIIMVADKPEEIAKIYIEDGSYSVKTIYEILVDMEDERG